MGIVLFPLGTGEASSAAGPGLRVAGLQCAGFGRGGGSAGVGQAGRAVGAGPGLSRCPPSIGGGVGAATGGPLGASRAPAAPCGAFLRSPGPLITIFSLFLSSIFLLWCFVFWGFF